MVNSFTNVSKIFSFPENSFSPTYVDEKNMQNVRIKSDVKDINLHYCDICGKTFTVPARLTRHYRIHTGEKPYQCEYCQKSFSVKENLSVHRRIHTKERPYKCEVCEKAFEHSGKLHRHMRIHTGERPHKCVACDKTFIQSGQLVIHMRTHTGEKPYICKSCGKGFTCSKQLKVHSRTHTGEKPYKCDICCKSFGYNHVLKLHQAAHYGEKFYKCILCQDTFTTKKLMEIHLKTHSKPSIAMCSELTFKFITKNSPNSISKIRKSRNMTSTTIISDLDEFTSNLKKINEKPTLNNMYEFKDSKTLISNPLGSIDKNKMREKNYFINNRFSNSFNHCDSLFARKSCDFDTQSSVYKNSSLPHHDSSLYGTNTADKDYIRNIRKQQETQNNFIPTPTVNDLSVITNDVLQSSFSGDKKDTLLCKQKTTLILPPRKRSKMILESMKRESLKLIDTRQCNSVIKFAKRKAVI